MRTLYVAGALLAWVALAFAYRWAENHRGNRYTMSTAMGLVGTLWAVGYAAASGADLAQASLSQGIVGAGQGAIQVILIPVFMAAVSRGDLSITWTVLTLSFSLAAAMAMIYPGEHPAPVAVVGLVLAGGAIALLGVDMVRRNRGPAHRRPRQGWLLLMSVSFVLNAVAMYAFSVASALKPKAGLADKLLFLAGAALIFGLGGLVLSLVRNRWAGSRAGLVGGVAAGTFMFAGALCTMYALSAGVPGHVVYPATTGGSSILVVVLSVALLKERPGGAGWLGVGVGLAALVLFSMATASGAA